jgi:hypothetical protein
MEMSVSTKYVGFWRQTVKDDAGAFCRMTLSIKTLRITLILMSFMPSVAIQFILLNVVKHCHFYECSGAVNYGPKKSY